MAAIAKCYLQQESRQLSGLQHKREQQRVHWTTQAVVTWIQLLLVELHIQQH